MSRPQTYEQALLNEANSFISDYSSAYDIRLQILEACASILGGFDIEKYWQVFGITVNNKQEITKIGASLAEKLKAIDIPLPMAISSLSREPLGLAEQKKQGAFYTDYRLSSFVSKDCEAYLKKDSNVADLAAGSGILLAGIAEKYYEKYPELYDNWVSNHVFAFDISKYALRGARAALSVYTASIESLVSMYKNWSACDSLLSKISEEHAFDIIVGNPPWGKVKTNVHAFLKSSEDGHVYGSSSKGLNQELFQKKRQEYLDYSIKLKQKYTLLAKTEPDMYIAFLQKAMSSLRPGGHLAYIIPAGLIRSQGTEALRRHILNESAELKLWLFDNNARYFEIDSRFKFVIISQNKVDNTKAKCDGFLLSMCSENNRVIKLGEEIYFEIKELEAVRPDLTVPECRTIEEKKLFFKLYEHGKLWKEAWSANIAREVDMTNDRPFFHHNQREGYIPVVEGRMVQQYRLGAKAYVSGSGRSAKWVPCFEGINPQFYIDKNNLNEVLRERVNTYRVGFCDIAGQTNERAMTSAIIPPNVVCGNKVPTIEFLGDRGEDYMYLWLAVTNSFVFDWMVRRLISTTINFFLLFSIPMPDISLDDDLTREIINKAKLLSNMESDFYSSDEMATLRSEIDVLVSVAFGLTTTDLELILHDFPLLDRAQQPLDCESQSTVTKDLVLSRAEIMLSKHEGEYSQRYKKAKKIKSKAYIPTEIERYLNKGDAK